MLFDEKSSARGEATLPILAGFAVGYGDPSYFSRDYKRVFGEPPRQHAARQHSAVW